MESDRKWVDLPDGSFIAQIYRINLNFMFSPNLTWYNYAQYENQNETIGWQSRFQWIIKPGKEIFLTFNSPLIDPMERFQAEIYEARAKGKIHDQILNAKRSFKTSLIVIAKSYSIIFISFRRYPAPANLSIINNAYLISRLILRLWSGLNAISLATPSQALSKFIPIR